MPQNPSAEIPKRTYSVHSHGGAAKLLSLESQEQDNPSRWYSLLSLLQITANVYHFADISLSAIPKGGAWSFPKQQKQRQSSEKTAGLDCIKHLLLKLCHNSAYLWLCVSVCVCEKVTVMVLQQRSGFWDASLTLSPGSISDHFNGLELGGLSPTTLHPPNQHLLACNKPL